ncbi:MarR family transcriptional regulator [Pseudomonas sp. PDM25]|uniref:MarR family transcriptional regulator n=1 Tax=Pseudomonas sp. PDM25 TaxID=2854772 RepID=UPI001C478CE6|nr:MarR family transcriptional regulator [Pseudomonas sp. PDM25]MBV7515873.1 MarR family transcriptional regulator [Pseudomonas sp. PDM25]
MKLFYQLFIASLQGADPETRWVFELLAADGLRTAGDAQGCRVEALAVRFRLPQPLVSDALGELVQLGLVVRERSLSEGKGRPAITYALSPRVVQTLTVSGPVYGVHAELLDGLLSGAPIATQVPGLQPRPAKQRLAATKTGRPAPPGASQRLSACNRLLFATLLARADHCGVVSGLGGPELRQLTGFDAASLKHRLRRLMDLGLIRRYVPGVSSSIFARARVSSTYFLNLNPGFGLSSHCSVMVHLAWDGEAKRFTHADILSFDVAAYERGDRGSALVAPLSVIRFLAGQRPRVYLVLQSLLYRYASFLLSQRWSALVPGAYLWDDKLYAMIRRDFRQPVAKVTGEDTPAETERREGEWVEIIEHFYRLTHEIAHEFRSRFGQATFLSLDGRQMSVLPVADDLGYKVITLVAGSHPEGAKAFVWLEEERPGVVRLRPEMAESEVNLINRYDFGLLTPPKRKTGKP